MCDVVGIDKQLVEKNQNNSGGAQYIINITDCMFWYKVYCDSVNLYITLQQTKSQDGNDIQIWCCEMWSTLWNMWKRGYQTHIVDWLDFSFATSHIDEQRNIIHNSGVTEKDKQHNLFLKQDFYNKYPQLSDLQHINEQYCSSIYTKWVQRIVI